MIKDLASIPDDIKAKLQLSKRQAESLEDENQDTEWAGDITIGSDDQKFLIDFDSASFISPIFPARVNIFPSRLL